jgi:hypothetical protein
VTKRHVEFNPDEFLASLERVRKGEDLEPARPKFDPQVARDVRDDKVRGLQIDRYHQVLEHCGFTWTPKEFLSPWEGEEGPIAHKEGMWRNVKMHMAFTSDQICEMFPRGPEEFFDWFTIELMKRRAARAGIQLPASGLIVPG